MLVPPTGLLAPLLDTEAGNALARTPSTRLAGKMHSGPTLHCRDLQSSDRVDLQSTSIQLQFRTENYQQYLAGPQVPLYSRCNAHNRSISHEWVLPLDTRCRNPYSHLKKPTFQHAYYTEQVGRPSPRLPRLIIYINRNLVPIDTVTVAIIDALVASSKSDHLNCLVQRCRQLEISHTSFDPPLAFADWSSERSFDHPAG